ncbi:MAG TPA: hypothetical protein VMV29_03225 [Ktedonobacterales bacterium]|nr:hypothetical protein [Ktedonobacterales bacterium]
MRISHTATHLRRASGAPGETLTPPTQPFSNAYRKPRETRGRPATIRHSGAVAHRRAANPAIA